MFKLERKRNDYKKGSGRATVRVEMAAYNMLVEMANETGYVLSKIASRAIEYAYKNLEYTEQND